MNTLFFKYALEVERTRSITRAAENLFMAQPNLSRAIKEAEDSLGYPIFERTSKGVVPTREGAVFLEYARSILRQLEEMEQIVHHTDSRIQCFSVAIPRGSYIAAALPAFISTLDRGRGIDMNIVETNSIQAIRHVEDNRCCLGIIRYQTFSEPYFCDYLKEKHMKSELLWEYECLVLMSAEHPLAQKTEIHREDLADYLELSHGDTAIPYIDAAKMRNDITSITDRRIYLYERGNQFEILSKVPDTFMWVSPVNEDLLKKHGLIQRKCSFPDNRFRDLLVYSENYHFTDLDRCFLEKLYESKTQVCFKEYY